MACCLDKATHFYSKGVDKGGGGGGLRVVWPSTDYVVWQVVQFNRNLAKFQVPKFISDHILKLVGWPQARLG